MRSCVGLLVIPLVIAAMSATPAFPQIQVAPSPAGGSALHLAGDHAAVAADNDSLDSKLDWDFTIEAWIYMEKLPEGDDQWTIIAKPGSYEWSIMGPEHQFARDGTPSFAFTIEPGPDHNIIIYLMSDCFKEGDITSKWHHLAYMAEHPDHDPPEFRYSFDGRVTSHGPFCAIPDSNSEFYVGGRPDRPGSFFQGWPDRPGSFFQGWIDELRISKICRYEENAFDPPEDMFIPDRLTMGLWHFDDLDGRFQDIANGNLLIMRKGGLSVDSSRKLATKWGSIKDE